MNKEQAWNLIDQVCAQINVSRETHIKIAEALKLLKPAEIHSPDNNRLVEVV